MNIQKAAGWILLAPDNKILLLKNACRKDWGLPKGHLEEGESEKDAACREMFEETGISREQIVPVENFKKTLSYVLAKQHPLCRKEVSYFLAHCQKEWPLKLSPEHEEGLWADTKQIEQLVSHQNLKELILSVATLKRIP
jgi:8-oxo-dGTP pyrophosphatase MutT (NUDIX family)